MNRTNIIIINIISMKGDSFKLADFTVPTGICCHDSQNLHSPIAADTEAKGKDGQKLELRYCTHSLLSHTITTLYAGTRTTLHGGTEKIDYQTTRRRKVKTDGA